MMASSEFNSHTKSAGGASNAQEMFRKIQSLLSRVKPLLAAPITEPPDSITRALAEIASLAESIARWRSKLGRSSGARDHDTWKDIIDTLDREGVSLWNATALLRNPAHVHVSSDTAPQLLAAARLAAFRMIDAGLESAPSVETLIHALQIASKTGVAIADAGQEELAIEVMKRAAHLEGLLSNTVDTVDGSHEKAKAAAVIGYYSCRMEVAAIGAKDFDQALFMLERITDADERRLSLLSLGDREVLSSKVLVLAKAILKGGPEHGGAAAENAEIAVKWLQKALRLVDVPAGEVSGSSVALKRSVLRCLARAFYLSSPSCPDNLNRANVTLNELLSEPTPTSGDVANELPQLRWMRLAVLKQQDAGEELLLEAFNAVLDGIEFTEAAVNDVIQEARSLTLTLDICCAILLRFLGKALSSTDTGHGFVERIFVSLLFVCSKESGQKRALFQAEKACSAIVKEESYELSKLASTACQSIIWQSGEKQYNLQEWQFAADWYILGTHEAFKASTPANKSKCLRKAALCYLEADKYEAMESLLASCSTECAATHFVRFLAIVRQGRENEAVDAVNDIVNAPDFDRKMLFLATQLAHDAKMKILLLSVLANLFSTLPSLSEQDAEESGKRFIEGSTLSRCLLRLIIDIAKEPKANMPSLVSQFCKHFISAVELIEKACINRSGESVSKDAAWLWRTGYNTAITGCIDWERGEETISIIFDAVEKLMATMHRHNIGQIDPDFQVHRALALFSSVAGRVFLTQAAPNTAEKVATQKTILQQTDRFNNLVGPTLEGLWDKEGQHELDEMIHTMQVFRVTVLCDLCQWDDVRKTVETLRDAPRINLDTYEAVADILWKTKRCPSQVLQYALEALLHGCLKSDSLVLAVFSRWLRIVVTLLLNGNSQSDREKALGYVEDAVELAKENGKGEGNEDMYPMDEREWMLSTCYNTGIECMCGQKLAEGKRWFEASIAVGQLLTNSQSLTTKVTDAYNKLMMRYESYVDDDVSEGGRKAVELR